MIENYSLPANHKFSFPRVGTDITLSKKWQFQCDYLPLHYKFWKLIGAPQLPIFKKSLVNDDTINYQFKQDVPDTLLARQLEFSYIVSGTRIKKLLNKPDRVYDVFAALITLPINTKLSIVSINLHKTERIKFKIIECEIAVLEGIEFSVTIEQALNIEYY